MAVRATQPLHAPCCDTAGAPVVVLSFPAAAVAGPDRIREVARLLVDTHRSGNRVVGVLSASEMTMAELVALATRVAERPEPREYDMLFSAGATIVVALCAMAVHDLGVEAISLSGSQAGIVTDTAHGAATIVHVRAERVREALARGLIVLVADAQGVSAEREVTTFGPAGANVTAPALAAALDASWEVVLDGPSAEGVPASLPQPSFERFQSSYESKLDLSAVAVSPRFPL